MNAPATSLYPFVPSGADFLWVREVNLSDPAGVLWKVRQKA